MRNMLYASIPIMLFFAACTFTPSFTEREFDLSAPFEYEMVYKTTRATDRAEFIIEGYLDGSGILLLPHDYRLFLHRISATGVEGHFTGGVIIKGNISFEYTATWYSDEAPISFTPLEPSTGWLRVRFRLR